MHLQARLSHMELIRQQLKQAEVWLKLKCVTRWQIADSLGRGALAVVSRAVITCTIIHFYKCFKKFLCFI